MNIQTLSDTELNRAMIWLYPPKFNIDDYGAFLEPTYKTGMVCHLTDFNLTMPLAFENNLNTEAPTFMRNLFRVYQYYIITNTGERCREATNKKLLRAICEVLVMIGMEGK